MAKYKQSKVAPKSYTITISEEEADALLTVLSNVGGDPHKTRRGLISKISGRLHLAGATRMGCEEKDYVMDHDGFHFINV